MSRELRRTQMRTTSKAAAKSRRFAKELADATPALVERAGGRCEARIAYVCGTGMAVAHRHHILERGQGGTNKLTNLLYCCDACHTYIHAHPTEAKAMGFLKESKWLR